MYWRTLLKTIKEQFGQSDYQKVGTCKQCGFEIILVKFANFVHCPGCGNRT